MLVNLNNGNTTDPIPYIPCTEPDGEEEADTFDSDIMSKAGDINAASRQLMYIDNNGNVPAKLVLYPGSLGQYNGSFTYRNSIIVFARAIAYYKANGALPDEISTEYKTPVPYMRGDPTGDARVDTRDIAALQRHMLGIETLTGQSSFAADMTNDGKINALDIVQIQAILLGVLT